MADCTPGCGACCDPVVLPFNRMDVSQLARCHPDDVRWMLDDLTPMPYREGARKAGHLSEACLTKRVTPDFTSGTGSV